MNSCFKLILASLALTLALAHPAAYANADVSAGAEEPLATPLVMIVAGFDGGKVPAKAAAYRDDYDWASALFGESDSPAAYFRDMSNGLFTFAPAPETSASGVEGNSNLADKVNDGVVHVTLHRQHGAWGPVNTNRSTTNDFGETVMKVLAESEQFIDFPSFDKNGDGVLTQDELVLCICIAGYEASSVSDFERDDIPLLWAHSGSLAFLGDDYRALDGVRFESYIAIAEQNWTEGTPLEEAEQEPLGVLYHELGHTLGLPDLYAVYTTEGQWDAYKTGALSIMDSGGWQYADDGLGLRNIPTALDGWSRYILGWTEPTIVAHSGDYTVSSQLSDKGYSSLIIPTSDPNQYYIVENRQAEGQDVGLAEEFEGAGGIVIWHADQTMFHKYYDGNRLNDVNHRPGVMEMFYEIDGESRYSTNWTESTPIIGEPFFDASSWSENLGGVVELELPLYSELDDDPSARKSSGITLRFDDASARSMDVHIELDDEQAAKNVLHLVDNEARERFSMAEEPDAISLIAKLIKAPIR